MIATSSDSSLLVRLFAPLVWRRQEDIARKLEGFAATEAGSALDMLKAAELTECPRLRRLFFRHALDEARHAQMFRAHAAKEAPSVRRAASEYNLIHATRQNLYGQLGLVKFLAFVYLAERRGERQFRSLAAHFEGRPELKDLFDRIGKDERFHVRYSFQELERLRQEGQGKAVARALLEVRFRRAWDTWRRMGRVLGDGLGRALLIVVYLTVLPLFALLGRVMERRPRSGWQREKRALDSLDSARRQF